ncbi:hypothetical protein MMC09_003585 [Bachmanniomyces sp. S44760]|nr:hypothetical protein [Bachmanniomyces sp. S44760]
MISSVRSSSQSTKRTLFDGQIDLVSAEGNALASWNSTEDDLPSLSDCDEDSLEPLPNSDPILEADKSLDLLALTDETWEFAAFETVPLESTKLLNVDHTYDDFLAKTEACFSDAVVHALKLTPAEHRWYAPSPDANEETPIPLGTFLLALHSLGLGRESYIFGLDRQSQTFFSHAEDISISGISRTMAQDLFREFSLYGEHTRTLSRFLEGRSTASPAFAAATRVIYSDLLARLESSSGANRSIGSITDLQSSFHFPSQIISGLCQMIQECYREDDVDLIDQIYEFVGDEDRERTAIHPIMLQLFLKASAPWLESVNKRVGLREDDRHGGYSLQPRTDQKGLSVARGMPTFVSCQMIEVLEHIDEMMAILDTQCADFEVDYHLRPWKAPSVRRPQLEWCFQWKDMARVEAKAKQYEADVRDAYKYHQKQRKRAVRHSRDQLKSKAMLCWQDVGLGPFETSFATGCTEEVAQCIDEVMSGAEGTSSANEERAPFSWAAMLSFDSILTTQLTILNRSCLRLLFELRNLKFHLLSLKQYQLFGNGSFSSHICQTLRALGLDTGTTNETQESTSSSWSHVGHVRWPPANYEIRIGLSGIASAMSSSHDDFPRTADPGALFGDLPGGLSFATRDFDAFRQYSDPNALEAQDFLRLSYKPPQPLDFVITPAALEKYDMLSRHLLRAVRMMALVDQSYRDRKGNRERTERITRSTQLFQIEVHHFISAIHQYMFSSMDTIWQTFEEKVNHIEETLTQDKIEDDNITIHQLRDEHEKMLDRMLTVLFLRQENVKVLKILEDLFRDVLSFTHDTRSIKLKSTSEQQRPCLDILERRRSFHNKVRCFIAECRKLEECDGKGAGRTVDQLILKLDMNGYYS